MRRVGLLGACVAGAVAMGAGTATPVQAKTFARVFQGLNNAFPPPLQAGCKAAGEKLNVTCTFMGPQEYDEATEVQMAQDMVQKGVDGLAVSAGNPKAMSRVLLLAKERHIPVVTFDSDGRIFQRACGHNLDVPESGIDFLIWRAKRVWYHWFP